MTPEEELVRARQAQEARDNPLITQALDAYEQRITESWQNAQIRDLDGQQMLHLQLLAAKAFRCYLETTIKSGKVAAEMIRRRDKLVDRMRAKLQHPFRQSR